MSDYLQIVQDQTINKLREMLRKFADSDSKTRVVPLAVPTGWGKTRIALQSVFRANYKYKPTIFLWPQKVAHLTEVWGIYKEDGKVCVEWRGLVDDDLNLKKLYHYDFYYVTNDFKLPKQYWTTKKKKGTACYKARKTVENTLKNCGPGPIVFIVDEWHMDGILESFRDYLDANNKEIKECKPQNKSQLHKRLATQFIREFFLVPRNKKIFVLLLSATPISLTKAMDDDDDDAFEKNIQSYVDLFKDLALVGNQEMVYELYKKYPQAVENQVKNLKIEKNGSIEPKLKKCGKWIDAYCGTRPEKCNGLIYMREQYAFAKNESLKLQALKSLLEEYKDVKNNSKRKFVIFCHYEKVAQRVFAYLKNNDANVCFLQKKNRKLIIDTFNGEVSANEYDPKYDYSILILMDRDSQGLSLHKNNPWLIHYELAWNPIRIIQRFGRVWRFKKEKKGQLHLTSPKVFYIPFTYSSEEEQINRLERRWKFLDSLKPNEEKDKAKKKTKTKPKKGKKEKAAKNAIMMDLSPIPMEYALGRRWTPKPDRKG